MLNWALRYAPVVKFVRTHRPASILEVGSGSQGLSYYLPHISIVGVDTDFPLPIAGNLIPIIATASHLPFENNTFDLVVSSDMLEHLPVGERRRAVDEMLRVTSKNLLLGFPSGDVAERLDCQISAELKKLAIEEPVWLKEHFLYPYPTSELVISGLPAESRVKQIKGNDNCFIHKAVILGEMKPRINRFLRRMDRIKLVQAFSLLFDSGETYRQIIIIEKTVS